MEMHASGFGMSGTGCTREGEAAGRQRSQKARKRKEACVCVAVTGTVHCRGQFSASREEAALLNLLVVWWGARD